MGEMPRVARRGWGVYVLGLALSGLIAVLLARLVMQHRAAATEREATRAALSGDVQALASIITEAPWVVHERSDLGLTLLHQVALFGENKVATASLLLDGGADANAADIAGQTPLHYAAGLGDKGLVSLLLSSGADPNLRASDGASPAARAKQGNFGDVQELLRRAGQQSDPE